MKLGHRRALVYFSACLALAAKPTHAEDGFFFIHISDVHAYAHTSEVIEHYGLGPKWLPTTALALFALRDYEKNLVPRYSSGILDPLRRAVGIELGNESFIGAFDAAKYFAEIRRSGSEIGNAERALFTSFDEIGGLAPSFVLNTGDIVFDSGRVPAAISQGWATLYKRAAARARAPVHHTIGNHELGFIEHEVPDRDDTRFGPGFFRSHFGPSTYSFERGEFRFIALDTHSEGTPDEGWYFNRMRPEVSRWLDTRLAATEGKVRIVMNHEPFFEDPEWGKAGDFAERNQVRDEGLLAKHQVDYTLTGHIHLPGIGSSGTTTHISTGALSGMHWVLPPDAAPRGYRLLFAKDRKLYGAWKRTGEPLVGFVCPARDPDLWAVCGSAGMSGPDAVHEHVVAIAADRDGPFATVRVDLAGQELPLERWGRYFVRAKLAPGATGELRLRATRSSGERLEARAELRQSTSE